MSWELHHVNIPAPDVRASAAFYTTIFGMEEKPFPFVDRDRGAFGLGNDHIAFFEDGSRQIHISKPVATMARDNGFYLNPVLNGHHAILVDDIEAVKARLEANDVYFADAGRWAFDGYYQIYCYDPGNNVVEINQRT